MYVYKNEVSPPTHDDLDVPVQAEEARHHEHEPPVPLVLMVRHHDARRDACSKFVMCCTYERPLALPHMNNPITQPSIYTE